MAAGRKRRGSPEGAHRVSTYLHIGGHESQVGNERMGDEHSIDRIEMDFGEMPNDFPSIGGKVEKNGIEPIHDRRK